MRQYVIYFLKGISTNRKRVDSILTTVENEVVLSWMLSNFIRSAVMIIRFLESYSLHVCLLSHSLCSTGLLWLYFHSHSSCKAMLVELMPYLGRPKDGKSLLMNLSWTSSPLNLTLDCLKILNSINIACTICSLKFTKYLRTISVADQL